MELQNFPETFAAIVEASDIIDCGSERRLLNAVREAGYWLDNADYPDIDSGSVSGLVTYQERREFAQQWADTIDTVVDEDYLNLEGIESLDDAYTRYCQAAVLWASSQLESKLQDAANLSPELLAELVECVQNARELDESAVWDDAEWDILPAEKLEELDDAGVIPEDIVGIWLECADAEVFPIHYEDGTAAGMMLIGDSRALWFPDASHRHA